MSITDELRAFCAQTFNANTTRAMELRAIADRIDEVYTRDVDTACALASSLSADALRGRGWIRLPLDADGELIHVGDVMEERSGNTFEVASLMAFGGCDNWLVLSDARNFSTFREPSDIRHYHPPTVEDVLDEFVARWMDTHHDDLPALKAEYAAKLRLIGEDE